MKGCGKEFYSRNAMRKFKCGIDKSFNHITGSKEILCPKCSQNTVEVKKT